VIHGDAPPSAAFYVSTILLLYLLGLLLILVHYMNSSYGSWNWNLADVWRELRPKRRNNSSGNSNGCNNPQTSSSGTPISPADKGEL